MRRSERFNQGRGRTSAGSGGTPCPIVGIPGRSSPCGLAVTRSRSARRHVAIRTLAVQFALLIALAVPGAAQTQTLRSPDVIFVPTPQEVVDVMLEVAHVTKNDIDYGLGSGDGRITIPAAKTSRA